MTARAFVILGGVCTIVGVLSPFAHLPFVGDLTYVLHGQGDGTIVICLCIAAGLIALRTAIPGILSGGIVAFMLYRFQGVVNDALAKMHESASNAGMFSGLVDRMAEAVYLEWGFYLAAAGTALMILGGILDIFASRRNAIATDVPSAIQAISPTV